MTRRTLLVTAAIGAAALLAAACTTGGGGGGANPTPTVATAISTNANHAPTTITVWTFNTLAKEVKAFRDDLDRLHVKYPWLTVKFVPGKDDAAYAKAVAAGSPPDVFISTAPDYVGQFCHNGTVLDMNAYLKAAGIDVAKTFPRLRWSTRNIRATSARCRCSPTRTASTTTRRCSPGSVSPARPRRSPS